MLVAPVTRSSVKTGFPWNSLRVTIDDRGNRLQARGCVNNPVARANDAPACPVQKTLEDIIGLTRQRPPKVISGGACSSQPDSRSRGNIIRTPGRCSWRNWFQQLRNHGHFGDAFVHPVVPSCLLPQTAFTPRWRLGKAAEGAQETPLFVPKFVQNMPIPPVKMPLRPGTETWNPGDCFHGIAPEYFNRVTVENPSVAFPQLFPEQRYELRVKEAFAEMIPGIRTPVLGYDGMVPGPTFKVRIGQPIVVRQFNDLVDTKLSTHLHGGHNPAHSDGFPNFYILPGKSRDYFYTNTVPLLNGKADFSESPSTCWYHDHAMDISGDTLIHGLCGFYLQCDDLELSLIAGSVLPGDPFDIPVMIQDRSFNADGTIFYDPLDHNGYLGDVYCVNGKAFPKLHVQRRKYRFRFLNGCYARHLELRLSDSRSFLGSATVAAGTPLRPHVPVRPEEGIETHVFEFTRRNGAWQINQRFFDEFRADACPRLVSAERWILRNGSGGWWHPVHIQLESLLHEM